MAIYGSFETVRELSNDLVGAVYSAQKTDAKDGVEYAIKVIARTAVASTGGFFAEVAEPTAGQDAAQIFEAAIARQKEASQSGAHVAPVLESGSSEQETWYATRLFPRTVLKLIQARVSLNEAGIRHVLLGAARGAAAFRQSEGRGHGNLKSSNILVGGEPKISDAQVQVVDPSGQSETQPGADELADLKALGVILYQFVFRKVISGSTDWMILPLQQGKEWTQIFGKRAEAWLNLCNRLLDPNLSLETYSLERLVTDLERLEPKAPISIRAVAVVALITLFGIGGVFVGARLMKVEQANVLITVDPAGVEVSVSGQDYGRIFEKGLALRLQPGRHIVIGRFQGGEGEYDDLIAYTNVIQVVDEEETQNIPIYLAYGRLEMKSQPVGAKILFLVEEAKATTSTTNRYYESGLTTPAEIPIIRPGVRQVLLRKEGYVRTNLTVNVAANQEGSPIEATLTKEIPGSVEVGFTSAPFAATVTGSGPNGAMFNFDSERDPFLSLLPGDYSFQAVSRNFGVLRTNVTVGPQPERGGMSIRFQFPNTEVGLSSRPRGATVWVDGTNVAINAESENQVVTDFKTYWPPGDTTFRFELVGYYTNTIRTNLVAGEDLRLSTTLVPMMGVLEVVATPPGDGVEFLVYSNGIAIQSWTTNVTADMVVKIQQPPGNYTVEARYPGLGSKFLTNQVKLGVVKQWPLRFDHGQATFRVEPPGVGTTEVFLNRQRLADEQFRNLVLAPGNYSYAATNSVLGELSGSIAIADNRTTPTTLAFPYAFMTITSLPPNALVYQLRADGSKGLKIGESTLTVTSKVGAVQFLLEQGTNKPYVLRSTLAQGANPPRGRDFTKFIPDSLFNSIGMELIWVDDPAGFRAGKYEVTQEEYMKVMGGSNPSMFSGEPRRPVENVSWAEAEAFCEKLTEIESSQGTLPEPGVVYRLPTDVEWNRLVGDAKVADSVFKTATNPRTQPEKVGSTEMANVFGLYDILGNVAEITIATDFDGMKTQGGSYLNRSHIGLFGTTFGQESKTQSLSGTGFRVILARPR